MEAHFGDTQQARADADAALRVVVVGSNPQFPWVAMALALSGDVKRAEKLATELDKRFPLNTVVQHYWLPTIRAAVALTRKDAKKAVELLSAITPVLQPRSFRKLSIILASWRNPWLAR